MKQFQTILLLILVCLYASIAQAAHHKGTAGSIANFIEANRRNREVVLNNPKYDKYAKVFYVYRCNSAYSMRSLKKYTEVLNPAQRKIFNKGADLIILLDIEYDRKDAKDQYFDAYKGAKQLSIKSPILNEDNKKVRNEIHKDSSYRYNTLKAIDANGEVLATFSCYDDEITQRDVKTRKEKVLAEGKFEYTEWPVEAILRSYKDLVAQVSPEEDAAATDAATEQAEKKASKKKTKEDNYKPAKWRKVEQDDSDDE
jgi:hypothetical protein